MYYEQCLTAAKPIVKHYFTDITEHDQNSLQDNQADIIYGLRECGSNLIVLSGEYTRREVEWHEAFMFLSNQHFYIGRRGKLRKVTKERAQAAWNEFIKPFIWRVPYGH